MSHSDKRGVQLCALASLLLLFLVSCAHKQQLVSISIQPASASFNTPSPVAQVQFTALGSYIHPPVTKDITTQVTWKTDIPQLITVSGGLVSPTGNGCGVADISASKTQGGNLIIGYATVAVKDSTNPSCSQAVLTVTLSGPSGSGAIVSSPPGIDCPSKTCGALFGIGTSIVLTETPAAGHTFGGWTNCTPTSAANSCSLVLNNDTNVVASFN